MYFVFFFSSRRRHTRCGRDWSSDVCSSDLKVQEELDTEVRDKIKNLEEGSRDWDAEYQKAMARIKRTKNLEYRRVRFPGSARGDQRFVIQVVLLPPFPPARRGFLQARAIPGFQRSPAPGDAF